MSKTRSTGFRKPLSKPGAREVGLAVISSGAGGATCSCGWATPHTREKPREDAVDRHLAKRHQGRGIWL